MIETAIKEDLILDKKLIIPKNKLDAIRIMNELHPVVGGQPTHEKDQPNDNNPILDLACTLANIHASGVGEHADLRPIQNEPPSFFYGEGFISGIASLKGNGILAIFGHWRDGSGKYAIKQFYYTDKEISYRNALSEDQWSAWIEVLTSNSQLDYNKLLNVPITSTLSDDKNKIASIFSVNEVNRKANTAQITANNADAKAVNAQRTADTGVANAKIADDKAGKAQSRADAAFTRVKPVAEGGTGATAVVQARINLGLKSAALADLTSTLSDAKDLAASIFTVNEVNRKVNTAQTTANNADAKAVAAQKTADKKRDLTDNVFEGRYLSIKEGVYEASLHVNADNKTVAISREENGVREWSFIPDKTGTIAHTDNCVGVDQSWRDMTSQRAAGTTYMNNTGRVIVINLGFAGASGGRNIYFSINNILIPILYLGAGHLSGGGITVIVPAGNSYRVDTMPNKWLELR